MNNTYDKNKWEASGMKNLFIWNFFLDGHEVPGWIISEKNIRNEIGNVSIHEYYWHNKTSNDEAIKIDIFEYPSWKVAQENLLEMLKNHMAPQLPEVNAEKKHPGDIAYAGTGKTLQHMLFVRANMLVILNSIGNKDIPVNEVADIIDEQFYSQPKPVEKVIGPLIEKFSVTDRKKSVTNNEAINLEIAATEPLNKPIWFKFFADQGEFFRENDQIFFIPAQKEMKRISVFVITENGISAEKIIE